MKNKENNFAFLDIDIIDINEKALPRDKTQRSAFSYGYLIIANQKELSRVAKSRVMYNLGENFAVAENNFK